MITDLPTAEELAKLPLRAVVAYAARTARRLSHELRHVVANDTIETALQLIEAVPIADFTHNLDYVSVISASESVAAAYAAAPTHAKSIQTFRILFSLTHAAQTAMYVLLAAADSTSVGHQMKRAAQAAERAVRPVEALGGKAAVEAAQAARDDYETLVREFGQQEEIVLGNPVHCFGGKRGGERGRTSF